MQPACSVRITACLHAPQDTAAAAAQPEHPHVLELWNLHHLQQEPTERPPASSPRHPAEAYEQMVQQYLQQEQPQQKQPQHRPPQRRHQPAQQQPRAEPAWVPGQQQAERLPEYATRAMLQAYGLQDCAQQMDVAAGLFANDVYVLQQPDAAALAAAGAAGEAGGMQPVVQVCLHAGCAAPRCSAACAWLCTPLMPPRAWCRLLHARRLQVWDDELPELQHVWDAQHGGGGDDSEDSNAEGHYANSYPDDDEGDAGTGLSDDDSAAFGGSDSSDGGGARGCCVDMGGGISSYQAARPAGRRRGVAAQGAGGCSDADDDEFDVDEYLSSGDEQPGLHGGTAWRAVLAAQHVPAPPGTS